MAFLQFCSVHLRQNVRTKNEELILEWQLPSLVLVLYFYKTKIDKLLTLLNITFRIKAKVKWIFSTISLYSH